MTIRSTSIRALVALCGFLFTTSLPAATFTVDSELDAVDDSPGDGVCDAGPAVPGPSCTLRAAIMDAEVGSLSPDCNFAAINLAKEFLMNSVFDKDESSVSEAIAGLTDNPDLSPLTRAIGQISYHHPPRTDAEDPSPVIDFGDDFQCQLNSDQTGAQRPVDFAEVANVNGPCDLGSVEAQVFDLLFNDYFE